MSSADRTNLSAPISAMVSRARAAAWLERHHRGGWTGQDQTEFDVWLAESPANMVAYVRVETAWKRADRLSVLRRPDFSQAPSASSGKAFSVLFAMTGVLVIAVAIGLTAVLGLSRSDEHIYTTGLGGHRIISFADGTQIELNTQTTVRMKVGSSSKEAWLDKGEAYFKITHDAKHPFVVFVGDRRVTDLGTRFLVRRDAGHLEVALLEGRALFDAPGGTIDTPVLLAPGDVITEKNRSLALTKEPTKNISDRLAWRHGMLVFKHTTLAEAAEEFNRYNISKIVIADRVTATLTIGGTFQVGNIGVFARSMRDLLGVQIQNRGNDTVISR